MRLQTAALLLSCLASDAAKAIASPPIEESAPVVDAVDAATAQWGGAGAHKVFTLPEESRRLRAGMLDRVVQNRRDLKREYMEATGGTEADAERAIEKALAEARDMERPRFGEEGFRYSLMRPIAGLEEYYDPEENERRLTHTLDIEDLNVQLISGLSPGWEWNYGRNEFLCVSVNIPSNGRYPHPRPGTDLLLLKCTETYVLQWAFMYTDDHEVVFEWNNDPFWRWCAESSKPDSGTVKIEKCDEQNARQTWSILGLNFDNSWRPFDFDDKCVTASPPEAGRVGHRGKIRVPRGPRRGPPRRKLGKRKRKGGKRKKGGKKKKGRRHRGGGGGGGGKKGALRIEDCTTEGARRTAQVFLICEETNSCLWDELENKINCIPSQFVCF